MVNFGPLAAEIKPVVWGTPANFNRFRVFAALLHGSQVSGISQTLRHWTEGATYIQQGGHHVGHWPTFLVLFLFCLVRTIKIVRTILKDRIIITVVVCIHIAVYEVETCMNIMLLCCLKMAKAVVKRLIDWLINWYPGLIFWQRTLCWNSNGFTINRDAKYIRVRKSCNFSPVSCYILETIQAIT